MTHWSSYNKSSEAKQLSQQIARVLVDGEDIPWPSCYEFDTEASYARWYIRNEEGHMFVAAHLPDGSWMPVSGARAYRLDEHGQLVMAEVEPEVAWAEKKGKVEVVMK